ncbi:MAG TPA: AtpZ/AtpI family protein [Gemmatimonadales bacterium]|nr:AtpZ/AtpI family protein [Gemmatimonadales bacterium]
MTRDHNASREVGVGYKYVSLGITFAGGIILFMALGFWLDRRFGLTPFGTVLGTMVGAGLSFAVVYRRLQVDAERERRERESRKRP